MEFKLGGLYYRSKYDYTLDIDNNFKMLICAEIYSVNFTKNGHFINAKTKENLGNIVFTYKHIYDKNGNLLKNPIIDENNTEVIYGN
jgi:hypothetical protein